jgi:hypothetical protein
LRKGDQEPTEGNQKLLIFKRHLLLENLTKC